MTAKTTTTIFDGTRFPPEPLAKFSMRTMRSFIGNPDPLVVEPGALDDALKALEASPPSPDEDERHPEARRASQVAACRWLLQEGLAGRPVTFTTCLRERQGGRRYYINVPGQTGVQFVSRKPRQIPSRPPFRWLQMIPRAVRSVGLRASDDRVLVQGDLSNAFPHILGAISGDAKLLADVQADLHDRVAARLGISRDGAKVVNNSIVGGIGVPGLMGQLDVDHAEAAAVKHDWWALYAVADAYWRDMDAYWRWAGGFPGSDRAEEQRRAGLRHERALRVITPDGRPFTFSASDVAGIRRLNGKRISMLTAMSAILRCVEGTVMDIAVAQISWMARKQGLDLRFVLGTYDGVIYSAPGDRAAEARAILELALPWAIKAVTGQAGRAKVWASRFWIEGPKKGLGHC